VREEQDRPPPRSEELDPKDGAAEQLPREDTPRLFAGSEVVEFSPSAELAATMQVAMKNMETMA
jgi:hypothetical protein